MVNKLLEGYYKTIDVEMFCLQPVTKTGWRANGIDIMPGQVYKDDNITVNAFENKYGSWDYSYGYRVKTPDRVIIISGDTAPFMGWEQAYAGADILIYEAYSYDPIKGAPVSKPYMESFHTSTKELADLLKIVKPKLSVTYHFVQFQPKNLRDNKRSEKEIKQYGYDGPVI